MSNTSPPKIFLRLFRWFCHPKLRDSIEGDLMELYEERKAKSGKWKADLTFIADVLLLFRPGIIKPADGYQHLNTYGMNKSYFKIGWRNLIKNKTFSIINIAGLAVGLCCFILFMAYALHEFSFDRFHKNADNIYRVYQWSNWNNTGDTNHPMPLGPAIKQDLSGVREHVRIRQAWQQSFARVGDEITRKEISFADPQFFSMFSFKFVEGNASTALNDLYSVVLTEETAKSIWGRTDVMGEIVEVKVQDKYEPFVVSAIVENIPSNSSIAFQILGNFDFLTTVTSDGKSQANDWDYSSCQTYVQLEQPNTRESFTEKLAGLYTKYHSAAEKNAWEKGWTGTGPSSEYRLQPLVSIHMDTNLKGAQIAAIDSKIIWILLSIATGILLISCINFITLTIGRSTSRLNEIGVRKVMGANKNSLAFQFLAEALLFTVLSTLLGLLLAWLLLPHFNQLSEREFLFSHLKFPESVGLVACLILATGILAGSYPAWMVSGFRTVDALKTKVKPGGSNLFTKSLVIFQFVLSSGLIVSTLIIIMQLNYMKSKSPGFNKENIIVVNAGGTWPRELYPLFKEQLAAYPGIIGVTGSDQTLGRASYSNTEVDVNGNFRKIYEFFVDEDYLEVMGTRLLAGRNFNPDITSDTVNAIIINETMMQAFGWTTDNAIGQRIRGYRNHFDPVVIGVVEDFNYQPFRMKIEPQMFHRTNTYPPYNYFVRIAQGDPSATLAILQAAWKRIAPDLPFRYSFLDEDLNRAYMSESRWAMIVGWAGGISVFLACFGLLGLTTLAATSRTKEIGIRKVLGATEANIAFMLSKDFLKLVAISAILAVPLAWWFMQKWLEGFAYRVNINLWVFLLAAAITLLIALLTLSFQAIRAAMMNPVNSLRSE